MQIEIIVGSSEISAKIAGIKRAGKKLDENIQIAACSIIAHVSEHREVSLANKLVDAMPRGARTNALLEFFCHFGLIKWDSKKKVLKFDKSENATADLDAAMDKPWWEFKPEPEFKPFDLEKQIAALIKKAKTAADSDEADLHKVDAQLLERLEKLAA